jgi:MFS family permease
MAWYAVTGLGTGVFISPNSSALMGAAPKSQQGVAGGVMAVARSVGMMVGVALATSIFVAAGGRTGHRWEPADFHALRVALWVAAGVALASAAAAALRGRPARAAAAR